jgi:hypothetical protein
MHGTIFHAKGVSSGKEIDVQFLVDLEADARGRREGMPHEWATSFVPARYNPFSREVRLAFLN